MRSEAGIIVAITAGVTAYIEEEKPLQPLMARRRLTGASNSWSGSGREEIMRMRTLWQRRIVSGR